MARAASGWRRAFGVGGVTLLGCSTYVVQWYDAILSDSLSISLLVLVVALVLRWQRTGTGIWLLVGAAGAWSMTRATNAYVLAVAAAVMVVAAAWRHRPRLAPALVVLAVAVVAGVLSGRGTLWQQPFLHSLAERILPDAAFTRWFADHGMPLSPTLRSLAGPYLPATDTTLRHAPALVSFRSWLVHSAKGTYLEFLVTHPGWALRGTFGRHEELSSGLISYYGGGSRRSWYPGPLRDLLLWHRQSTLIALWAVAGATVVAARRRWRRSVGAVWVAVAVAGLFTLIIDWAGDSWEVGRHSVDGTLIVALAAVAFVVTTPATSPSRQPPSEESP